MAGSAYTMPLRVRLYDLDLRDQVSTATLFRFLEETAMQASSHLGFTLEWYRERDQFWVIRTIRLERTLPARYEDELEIRTWISAMGRIRADRNYLVRRVRDGQVLARATANWVYLDSRSMFPARIDPAIVAMFSDVEPPALPERSLPHWLCPPERPLQSTVLRQAQYYEADGARHTNNAVYVEWLEEAARETLLANGYTLPIDGPLSLWFHRRSLEYLSAVRPGDTVEISTRLAGRGRSAGRWLQEIRRAGTGERVARSECITLWRGEGDQLQSWMDVGRRDGQNAASS